MRSLNIIAGPQARAHLAREGLRPEDISVIPGAAGGPKGLILQGLDQHLFGDWLGPTHLAKRVEQGLSELVLIGASIGGWRMAAACGRIGTLAELPVLGAAVLPQPTTSLLVTPGSGDLRAPVAACICPTCRQAPHALLPARTPCSWWSARGPSGCRRRRGWG